MTRKHVFGTTVKAYKKISVIKPAKGRPKHTVYRDDAQVYDTSDHSNTDIVALDKDGIMGSGVNGITTKHKSKTLSIDLLYSARENKLKAAELYRHLMKQHDYILRSGDSHSKGAMKTWRKLAKMKNVVVHGWDDKTNQPVDVDPKRPEDFNRIWHARPNAQNLTLIAFMKKNKRKKK